MGVSATFETASSFCFLLTTGQVQPKKGQSAATSMEPTEVRVREVRD